MAAAAAATVQNTQHSPHSHTITMLLYASVHSRDDGNGDGCNIITYYKTPQVNPSRLYCAPDGHNTD